MDDSLVKVLHHVEELEAAHACRNLMGRFVYYNATFRNREILPLWSERADSRIDMPWGWYSGRQGVEDYLEEQRDRHEQDSAVWLKGVMKIHELDTEVIEVAADGRTAKGVWISPGHDTSMKNWAPIGEWRWCKYAVDFIKEGGEWKLWKLFLHPLFKNSYYTSWVKTEQPKPEDYPYKKARPKEAPDWAYSPTAIYPADKPEPPLPCGVASGRETPDTAASPAIAPEQLRHRLDRMQAVQDCRNLMGEYSLLHTAYRNKEYVKLWANREDCVLLMPWAAYFGKTGVDKCYLIDHGDRDDEGAEENPQLHGGMFMHCMDTEIIEVAEDGATARGIWLDPGHETYNRFVRPEGEPGHLPATPGAWEEAIPNSDWCWGKYLVNFIKEGGVWKFWQMQLYPLARQSFYRCWTHMRPYERPEFMAGSNLPEPIWEYGEEQIYPPNRPDPPVPYQTFDMAVHGIMAQYERGGEQ